MVIEGTFEGRRSEDYTSFKSERSQIVRHEDNLTVTGGQFYGETTSKTAYNKEIEEDSKTRRNTYTKEESDATETIRRRTWTKEELEAVRYKPIERPTQVKPTDNLKPEGEFYSPEKDQYKPGERPQQFKPTDNLRPEGDFVRDKKPGFVPAERPTQVSPQLTEYNIRSNKKEHCKI